MNPAPVTDEMVAVFGSPLEAAVKRTFLGPDDMPNVDPCDGIVERAADGVTAVVRVPLQLEPQEMTKLLKGGTVWVSMWGGLAPFAVEVVSGADDDLRTAPNAQKALFQREIEAVERTVAADAASQ